MYNREEMEDLIGIHSSGNHERERDVENSPLVSWWKSSKKVIFGYLRVKVIQGNYFTQLISNQSHENEEYFSLKQPEP